MVRSGPAFCSCSDKLALFYPYPPFVAFFKAPAMSGTQKKSRPHDTRWSAILKLTPLTTQPSQSSRDDVEWLPSNPKWREVFFGGVEDSCWKVFQRNPFLWFRPHHVDVSALASNLEMIAIPWLTKSCWRSLSVPCRKSHWGKNFSFAYTLMSTYYTSYKFSVYPTLESWILYFSPWSNYRMQGHFGAPILHVSKSFEEQ